MTKPQIIQQRTIIAKLAETSQDLNNLIAAEKTAREDAITALTNVEQTLNGKVNAMTNLLPSSLLPVTLLFEEEIVSNYQPVTDTKGQLPVRNPDNVQVDALVSMYNVDGIASAWNVDFVNATLDNGVVANIDNILSISSVDFSESNKTSNHDLMTTKKYSDFVFQCDIKVKDTGSAASLMFKIEENPDDSSDYMTDYVAVEKDTNGDTKVVIRNTQDDPVDSSNLTVGEEYRVKLFGLHEPKYNSWFVVLTDKSDNVIHQAAKRTAPSAATHVGLKANKNVEYSGISLSTIITSNPNGYTGIVTFGDSITDGGNFDALTGDQVLLNPPYGEKGFNAGEPWPHYLSRYLGVESPTASLDGGYNYAFGGARILIDALSVSVNDQELQIGAPGIPSLKTQINNYLTSDNVQPDALHILLCGGNDLLYFADNMGTQEQATATTQFLEAFANVGSLIKQLVSEGGIPQENIFTCNAFDSSLFPAIRLETNRETQAVELEIAKVVPAAITGVIRDSLNVNNLTGVQVINLYGIFANVLGDLGRFGFTHNGTDTVLNHYVEHGSYPPDLVSWPFFDENHLTTYFNAILARGIWRAVNGQDTTELGPLTEINTSLTPNWTQAGETEFELPAGTAGTPVTQDQLTHIYIPNTSVPMNAHLLVLLRYAGYP